MKKNPITRKRYRIGQSGIHGRGTFATEEIRKNTRIVEYLGTIITDDDLDDRPEDPDFVWLFDLEDGRYIDGDPALPENAEPLSDHVEAPPELLRALRQIGLVEKADGPRLQLLLKPGQALVSHVGDLWRWDGLVAPQDAPTAAAQRLAARNRIQTEPCFKSSSFPGTTQHVEV